MCAERKNKRLGRKKEVKGYDVPRFVVFKSSKHFYIQLVDDNKGHTLFSTSTLNLKLVNTQENVLLLCDKVMNYLKEQNIERVVFDKNGFFFSGNVKLIAERLLNNNYLVRKK